MKVKFTKQMYYTKRDEKLNSYKVNIPKEIVRKANMQDTEYVNVYVEEEGKIIIEKQ